MALGALTACSPPHGAPTAAATALPAAPLAPSSAPATSPGPPAAPTRAAVARPTSPLTGLPAGAGAPVLAVKIDNTADGRPQLGVGEADVVYLEQVEAGLTRLCALFSSRLPARVGPVRSVRESDIELLRPYGRVAFAYSGGNRGVLAQVRRANLADASYDAVPPQYLRSERPAPYNLYAHPAGLLAARHGSARAHDVGLAFGPPPGAASPARSASFRFARASVGWTWDRGAHRWLLAMDGRPDVDESGRRLGAENVVVQYVKVTGSRYRDVNGAHSPIAHTVGAGRALVFRDGGVFQAQWSRRGGGPTRFTVAGGRTATLSPGRTWVMLVPAGTVVPRA